VLGDEPQVNPRNSPRRLDPFPRGKPGRLVDENGAGPLPWVHVVLFQVLIGRMAKVELCPVWYQSRSRISSSGALQYRPSYELALDGFDGRAGPGGFCKAWRIPIWTAGTAILVCQSYGARPELQLNPRAVSQCPRLHLKCPEGEGPCLRSTLFEDFHPEGSAQPAHQGPVARMREAGFQHGSADLPLCVL